MGFLDDLDNKISGMGKKIGGKVNDIADNYKIQGAMNDLEARKKNCYFEIGRLYYNSYKQGIAAPENEALQLYRQIDGFQQQIQQYAEQLQLLKGVVLCPNCQGEVPIDSMFCGQCGTKMPPRNMNNQGVQPHAFCNNCGTPIEEGQCFCTVCGKKLENFAIQESVEEEYHSTAIEQEIENVIKVCPNCGKTISDGQTFCIYCGTPVR